MPFHSLGREVFLSPAHFDENGRLFAGLDGTTDAQYEIKGDFVQNELPVFTFGNTEPSVDWCYLRKYHPENYKLSADKYELCGTDLTLDDMDSPTFIARSAGGLCVSQLPPGRRNISQAEALCCGKTGHCGRAALGVCAVFRFEDARSYAGSWLG